MYRLLAVIGGVLIPLGRFVFPEEAIDPWWLRGLLSTVFLSVVAGTFISEFVRKQIQYFTLGTILVYLVWNQSMLYLNHLDIYYFISYILGTILMFLLPLNRVSVILLIAFSVIGTAIVVSAVPDPVLSPLFVLLISLAGVSMGATVVGLRFRLLSNEHQKELKFDFINSSAISAVGEGILLVKPDGAFIRANDTFLRFFEMPAHLIEENRQEEAVAHAMQKVTEPERLQRLMNRPYEVSREDPSQVSHMDHIEFHKGLILEISFASVLQNGTEMGRMWFFRDVTKQKKYERDLIDSERRIRERNARLTEIATHPSLKSGDLEAAFELVTRTVGELLQADTVTVWYFNFEQEKLICQKNYQLETHSFEKDQAIEFELFEDYIREIVQQRLLVIHDTRQHAYAYQFLEGKYTGRAGAICQGQIRSGEELIGVLAVESREARTWTIEDQSFITSMADLIALAIEQDRRRKMEEELAKTNNILTATFQLSETGILVTGPKHERLLYNELYLKTFRLEEDFLRNAPYDDLLAYVLEQLKEAQKLSQSSKMLSKHPEMEAAGIIEFKDGRVVERYSKTIELGEGQKGRVWFYLDVTDRTRKENELIERNFELDSFVYRASHDLKAPLNSIMGLISLIRPEEDLELVQQYVGLMDKSVKKLDEFIKQLTQFSQDARLKLVRKPIDLLETVAEIWNDLGFMEHAERIEFLLDGHQEGEFYGDPVRLGIVLNNFISNAIKYQDLQKETSQIKVHIQAHEKEAIISVADNGVGIPQNHLDRVFELFFRASVQATGSGLGLYITRSAAEKMGGRLEVESDPGKGSTFRLIVPNRIDELEIAE